MGWMPATPSNEPVQGAHPAHKQEVCQGCAGTPIAPPTGRSALGYCASGTVTVGGVSTCRTQSRQVIPAEDLQTNSVGALHTGCLN